MLTKRKIGLILLLLGGIGSLVYGSLFHAVTVEEEKQREISVAVPSPFGFGEPPARGAPQGNPGNPLENAPGPPDFPGVRFEKVTEKYFEAHEEPERAIVRDVTVGGVARLADGQLRRTYSGKGPSLCPS
jgi:hypothetical protein